MISLGLFLAVGLFTFLSWFRISALGVGFDITGGQLITGVIYTTEVFGQKYSQTITEPMPLAAIPLTIALIGAIFCVFKGRWGEIARGIIGIIGFVSVLIMASVINGEISQKGYGLAQVNWQFGFWLTLLAFLASAGLNFLTPWLGLRKRMVEPPATEPVIPTSTIPSVELLPHRQSLIRLTQGLVAIVVLAIISGIVSQLPGMQTWIERIIRIDQLVGIIIAALTIWILVSRIKDLNACFAHYGGNILKRFVPSERISQISVSSVWIDLSRLIIVLFSWLIAASQIGFLRRYFGLIDLTVTLLFLSGIIYLGYRLYRGSEPFWILIGQQKSAASSIVSTETKCPNCDSVNPVRAKFCLNCGNQLQKEEVSS